MKKIVFLVVAVMTMFMVTCKNQAVECPQEIFVECARRIDIVTVKAIIRLIQHPDDECPSTKYEVASVSYENGEFELNELNFPKSVQDECLLPIHENFVNIVSDIQAKTAEISIQAYNTAGIMLGFLIQRCGNWYVYYVYADRCFTQKGSIKSGTITVDEYDCSYEEGLNIVYYSVDVGSRKYTTQKPSNEDCQWHFQSLCPD